MKIFILSNVTMVLTATGSLAGNCTKHNKTNMEAMSCEVSYTRDEVSAACVRDASA